MNTTQYIQTSGLSTEIQLAFLRALANNHDDDCANFSGLNLSDIDDTPISILDLKEQRTITDLDREGATFMWKTLLIRCLISMDYEDRDNLDELADILRGKYEGKQQELDQIEDFRLNYKKNDAIRWYKNQSCVYQQLNLALRSSCLNLIFAFRFFIRDLSIQLRKEQKHLSKIIGGNVAELYRGQRTSKEEIEKLKKLKRGCLISVDSFYSTSRNPAVANYYMEPKVQEDIPRIRIRYDIQCDIRLKTKPYADVSAPRLGPFSLEDEVLFMVGTIFKFRDMFYDHKLKCWRVKLTLMDENSHRLSDLYQSIDDEMEEKTDLLTLGSLLNEFGDYEHALRIYIRSVLDVIASGDYESKEKQQQLTSSMIGIAGVECELGRYDDAIDLYNHIIRDINEAEDDYDREFQLAFAYYGKSLPLFEKGNNLDALKNCRNALKYFLQFNDHTNSFVASCYEMIGNIYGNLARVERIKHNMNDSNQHVQTAFLHYNKALKVRRKLHKKAPDHHEICATYINIGELYRDIGQSDEALKYTLAAYNGFRKAFPNNHSWIGIALDNIGEIFVQQQKYTEAKEKYDEAIKIFKKTLPSDHRYIGETLHNIGKLYCCTYAFDKALHYFKQAKKIYNTKISKDHYLVTELNEQMNYAASQLHGVGG